MEEEVKGISQKHEEYHFQVIPTNDVRDKDAVTERPKVEGLIDKSGKNLKPEHIEEIKSIFNKVNDYNL